ncbi:MAG: ribonuclease III [Candidatus Hydrogenedentota bacterium]
MIYNKIDAEYKKELSGFLKEYNLKPDNIETIILACTHCSFAYESGHGELNNERLEFLGDAVVELIISDYFFKTRQGTGEGLLTKMRSAVVNAERMAETSKRIGLERFLLLASSADKSGDRKRISILSDLYEAFVGAIYLTCHFKNVYKFVLKTLKPNDVRWSDPKSELQEYCQANFKNIPQYNLIDTFGPQHRKSFVVEVVVNKIKYGPAIGLTKKEAEQEAARIALNDILRISTGEMSIEQL